MSESIYLIYKHTSPSGKSYIGQTKNPRKRYLEHQRSSSCIAFAAAIKKYGGLDNFTYEILEENLSIEKANEQEQFYIHKYDTFYPNGYNLTTGGSNCIRSEETRRKLGYPKTEEHKQKLSDNSPNKGKPGRMKDKKHTEEALQKMMGHPVLDETRQKLSVYRKGKPSSSKGRKRIIDSETGKISYIKRDIVNIPL